MKIIMHKDAKVNLKKLKKRMKKAEMELEIDFLDSVPGFCIPSKKAKTTKLF
jgi:hypothetical protein